MNIGAAGDIGCPRQALLPPARVARPSAVDDYDTNFAPMYATRSRRVKPY